MIGGVLRIEALRALAALIQIEIPELEGRVCVGTSNEREEYPNLSIQPTKWTYIPEQPSEAATLPGNRVVYDVGDHSCACVISVVATSAAQRWELEAKVLDLFMRTKHPHTGAHMPGVILLQITACPDLSRWLATFDLESDEWNDTLAQDHRYESRIVATAEIPALTVDAAVYTIEQLILGVAQDLGTPVSASPPVELVTINADGTITALE